VGWRRSIFESLIGSFSLFVAKASQLPISPQRIFVLRNNDIGDLLVVTPLFEALKRTFPDAGIFVGIGSWNSEVLLGNPHVYGIVEVNAPWHNHFVRPQGVMTALRYIFRSDEAKAVQSVRAEIGIDVLGSGFGSLLLMRAGIPFRLGVRGYAGGDCAAQTVVDYCPDEHVGRQALRFAELLGCTKLPENRPQIFLKEPPRSNGAIVIAPGVGLPEKGWPGDYFVELAALLQDEQILVIGSQKDVPLASQICSNHPKSRDLSGKLTLRESFAMIGGAKLVICNSSMAMHASAAFRRPTVALLGEWFPSAAQHHRQWGYPETVVLGRDENRDRIFTPAEVAATVLKMLGEDQSKTA
jgi:ADP-heptose:LPS heptosyltransferase